VEYADFSAIVGSLKNLVIKASGRLKILSHSTSGVGTMTLSWKLGLEMRGRFLGLFFQAAKTLVLLQIGSRTVRLGHNGEIRQAVLRAQKRGAVIVLW
jgi:hypothetical protein